MVTASSKPTQLLTRTMRSALCVVLLATAPIAAHITVVCSVTAPSQPSTVWFVFGTYHAVGLPDGEVIIDTPSGDRHSASFTTNCQGNAKYYSPSMVAYSSYYADRCPGPDMKSRCSMLPSDSVVTCYTGDDPRALVSVEDGGCDAFPATSSTFSKVDSCECCRPPTRALCLSRLHARINKG